MDLYFFRCGKFSAIISCSKFFASLHLSLFFSGAPLIHILLCLVKLHKSCKLSSLFFSLFFFLLWLDDFQWSVWICFFLFLIDWVCCWIPLLNFKLNYCVQFSSVQSLSHVQLFVTPWTAAHQASLSITNSWNPPKPMSIESVIPSNHLIFCYPLLLLPSIFPSIRVFLNESALCIRWPKYWSFSFNISPSNEHSRLISFRMDCFDLLAVQGTLKSLLQHHGSKASIFQPSNKF